MCCQLAEMLQPNYTSQQSAVQFFLYQDKSATWLFDTFIDCCQPALLYSRLVLQSSLGDVGARKTLLSVTLLMTGANRFLWNQ